MGFFSRAPSLSIKILDLSWTHFKTGQIMTRPQCVCLGSKLLLIVIITYKSLSDLNYKYAHMIIHGTSNTA